MCQAQRCLVFPDFPKSGGCLYWGRTEDCANRAKTPHVRWTFQIVSGMMLAMTPDENRWMRLGELLIARRVELGYRSRSRFVAARGGGHDRIVGDLERAGRDNYSPATIAAVERMYQWEPGSIRRILAGGMPTKTPNTPGAEDAAQDAAEQPAEVIPLVEAVIEILRSRFGASTQIAMITDVIRADYPHVADRL